MIHLKRKVVEPTYNVDAVKTDSLILYTGSVVDPLILTPTETFKGGKEIKVHNVKRDISLLFNQERLDNVNGDMLKRYFSEHSSDDSLKELRAKCTDDQLLQMCRSRYIQSPSEIQQYFNFLEHSYDAEVKNLLSQQLENNDISDVDGSDKANAEGSK